MKTLGLAVIGAVLVVASIGPTTASATSLCEFAETACSEAHKYFAFTKVWGKGTTTITGLNQEGQSEFETKCKGEAIFETRGLGKLNETLSGEISALNFTECNNICSVKANELTYEGHLNWLEGSNNGILSILNPSLTLTCAFGFVKCRAGAPEAWLKFVGGAPAKLQETAIPLELEANESGTCPASADWSVSYSVTSPKAAIYVSM